MVIERLSCGLSRVEVRGGLLWGLCRNPVTEKAI